MVCLPPHVIQLALTLAQSSFNQATNNTSYNSADASSSKNNTKAEKRAEAKRELLQAWEAFKEGRADSIADKITTISKDIFGRASWTRQLELLGTVVPETQHAQELRRKGGKEHLITAWLALEDAGDETGTGLIWHLGEETYDEWSTDCKKFIDAKTEKET